MKIDLTRPAPENCPSFDKCQFNNCPLEKKPNNFKTLPEDKLLFNFHKCRCTKTKRTEIAKVFNMKTLGLTLRELSAMRQSATLKQNVFFTQGKKIKSPKTSTLQATSNSTEPLQTTLIESEVQNIAGANPAVEPSNQTKEGDCSND